MKRLLFAVAALSWTLTGLSCRSSLVDCTNVSLDKCGSTPGCLPLEAQPIDSPDDPSKMCLLDPQFVSCGNTPSCDKLVSIPVQDPMGRSWVMLSPCIPAGWKQLAASATIKACAMCETLSVAECAGTDFCHMVTAQQIDAQRTCLLPAQDVGCQLAPVTTPGFHRRVVDPAGNEWLTATNFIPPGWTDSRNRITTLVDCPASTDGGDDGDAFAAPCESFSTADCATIARCRVLEGKMIEHARACVDPQRALGCAAADATCGDAFTRATDPQSGIEWSFPSTCTPAGWTNVSQSNAFFLPCP